MARSKATAEYIPNLTSKKFFCMWITRKSGGGSDVTGDVGSTSTPGKKICDIQNFVARIETGDGAFESY